VRRHRGVAGLAAIGTQFLIVFVVWLLPVSRVGATHFVASPKFIFSVFAELVAGAVIGWTFPRSFASVALFLVPTVLAASFASAFATPGEDGPGNLHSLLGAAILAVAILVLFFAGYGAERAARSCVRRLRTPRQSTRLATDRTDI
jgi:hypothetical protein